MKLIIDIPEEKYKHVCEEQWLPNRLYFERAIANGTPLDVKIANMRMKKEEILHHFQDINFYYNDCMMYDDLSRMLDELIAENKGEWIPVSERLPENDEDVLVYDNADIFVAWYSEKVRSWGSADDRFDEYTPIIAWQPLPEPYKKGGE